MTSVKCGAPVVGFARLGGYYRVCEAHRDDLREAGIVLSISGRCDHREDAS